MRVMHSTFRIDLIDYDQVWHLQVCLVIFLDLYQTELRSFPISDTRYYVTDPDVEHVPVQELLSKVRPGPHPRF